MGEEQTLREWGAQTVQEQPLFINCPDGNTDLKSGMKPHGANIENLKLKTFPFSLMDAAWDWLHELGSGSITSWSDMVAAFFDKFFPASKTANLRKAIYGAKQRSTESLHDYWVLFKKLCASCSQHGIFEQLLIHYFYEGLLPLQKCMINAASGGSIVDKTPAAAKTLITTFAESSKGQGDEETDISRHANFLMNCKLNL